MSVLDARLIGDSRMARLAVVAVVALGGINGALAIGAAWVLSQVLAGAVQHQTSLTAATPMLLLVTALVLARGAVMWLAECAGHAGARAVTTGLRTRLLRTLAEKGPALVADHHSGTISMAATTGIDGLDVYFARYQPQLVLGTIIPIMVLAFLVATDVVSAIIVALTLPLIPIFMWLIGSAAQARIDRRWALLHRLAAYFLDVIQGLPTLRIFGRAEMQVEQVRTMTEAARQATMGTLSIAFLSSLVLESLASLATALVAAAIGLRLVDGTLTLQIGLAALIVVPEAYLPLRQLGTYYHAGKEGLSAAMTILDLVDPRPGDKDASIAGRPGSLPGQATGPHHADIRLRSSSIHLSDVTYVYGNRREGLVHPLTFSIAPLTTTLICGASGVGKSTLLALLVPFMPCTTGTIRIGDRDLGDLAPSAWRHRVGWVSQRPSLFAGTVLDNIRLGAQNISAASAASLVARVFPEGTMSLSTRLTADGEGLSGGERSRLALIRAVARSPSLLLLDEPTTYLDPLAASAVRALIEEISVTTTLVIATHEPEGFPWAERVIHLDPGVAPVAAVRLSGGEAWSDAAL